MENFFKKTQGRCFGTFNLKGEQLALSFKHALDTGYNFFDTAQWYENEFDLGEAIKKTGINRSDILITTKVHPDNYKEELSDIAELESTSNPDGRSITMVLAPIGGRK